MTKSKINFSLLPKCTLIRQIFLKRQKKRKDVDHCHGGAKRNKPISSNFFPLGTGKGGEGEGILARSKQGEISLTAPAYKGESRSFLPEINSCQEFSRMRLEQEPQVLAKSP